MRKYLRGPLPCRPRALLCSGIIQPTNFQHWVTLRGVAYHQLMRSCPAYDAAVDRTRALFRRARACRSTPCPEIKTARTLIAPLQRRFSPRLGLADDTMSLWFNHGSAREISIGRSTLTTLCGLQLRLMPSKSARTFILTGPAENEIFPRERWIV